MSQDAAAQSDVVKKGILKYRASKVKGTNGSTAQGPRSAKHLFVVFRAVHTGEKFLHMFSSDKKYHEAENPKWKVCLNDAASVYLLTDKKSYCVAMSDGGLLFLDASTLEEAEEWVRCLNAVLYAKGLNGEGTLQYEVSLQPNAVIGYHGPAVLELRDHDLIVWQSQTWDEILRWKLNHLRSFKAKKHNLTIVAGKRSCTGLGEFVFKSKHSILITHAIETVVAKVKYRSSPTMNSRRSVSPQPQAKPHSTTPVPMATLPTALPTAVPDMRDPNLSLPGGGAGGSVIASIPDFEPPGVYDDLAAPQEEYGRLEHSGNHLRPKQLLLETDGGSGYERTQHHQPGRSPSSHSPSQRHSPPRRGDIRSPNRESPPGEEYGKLEHTRKPKTSITSPPRLSTPGIKPSRPGYEDIDLDFPSNREEEYGKLERNGATPFQRPLRESRDASKSPALGRRAPPKPVPYAVAAKKSSIPSPGQESDSQERIPPNHTHNMEDQYESLEEAVHPEDYTKLSRSPITSPSEDEYNTLGKGNWDQSRITADNYDTLGTTSKKNKFGGSLSQAPAAKPHLQVEARMRERHSMYSTLQEEYGKLHRGTTSNDANSGKPKPLPRQSSLQTDGEYGHLDRKVPGAPAVAFDPYATFPPDVDPQRFSINSNTSQDSLTRSEPGDAIEEEFSTPMYSTISKQVVTATSTAATEVPIYSSLRKPVTKKQPEVPHILNGAPPPGYDNVLPVGTSAAAQAASQRPSKGVAPAVPLRASERAKLRYQNVAADGRVLLERQPLADDSLVDNELYGSSTGAVVGNDYVEDIDMIAAAQPESVVSAAPKPKVKPRPKRSGM